MRQHRSFFVVLAVFAMAISEVAMAQAPTSVTLNPITVQGGQNSTGQVNLSGPAPAGGVVVQLSTSNTAVATIAGPDSVTVPQGATSAIFTVNTTGVAEGTLVTIAATAGAATQTALLTIQAASLSTIQFSGTSEITGGLIKIIVIRLTGKAPTGGIPVQLSSTNTAAATVPSVVTVPGGADAANVEVATVPVNQSTPITITATSAGVTKTSQLNVVPLGMSNLLLLATNGEVRLNGPAPAAGFIVALSSSNTAVATVPATVTVPSGASAVSFPLTFAPVAEPTLITITAAAGGVTDTAQRNVLPPTARTLIVSAPTQGGGQNGSGTLTLTGPASNGFLVPLSSSNTSVATVPASVSFTAGSTEATFVITTFPVAQSTPVTITATTGSISKSDSLTIEAFALEYLSLTPGIRTVAVSPSIAITGGTPATGEVGFTGLAPAGGVRVALSNSHPAVAKVPSSVTVPAGSLSMVFHISSASVTQPTAVTITATADSVTKTALLNVLPVVLSSVTFPSANVTGGTLTTGQVNITEPGPPGGGIVALSSSNTAVATVTPSVTVPEGATAANFTVNTAAVAQPINVTISAAAGGVTKTKELTVVPPVPAAVTISPGSVPGGAGSTGEVTLTGPVVSGNLLVTLTSNRASATLPPSVTVPAGTNRQTFPITTIPVAQTTSATITAAVGNVMKTAQLNIAPPELTDVEAPNDYVIGGTTVTGAVSLKTVAPAGGLPVALSSDDTTRATVPPSVIVPAGATTASFNIAAVPERPQGQVRITGSAVGVSQYDLITVRPLVPVSISLSPATISRGQISTGLVTLNGTAPAGYTVQITSSNPLVASFSPTSLAPLNLNFLVGERTATFTIISNPLAPISSTTNVTITAARGVLTLSGGPAGTVLTVRP